MYVCMCVYKLLMLKVQPVVIRKVEKHHPDGKNGRYTLHTKRNGNGRKIIWKSICDASSFYSFLYLCVVKTFSRVWIYRPIECQSRSSWSQRGTKKVNGSHHGDNPLLRPTGIVIATKPLLPVPTNRQHRKLIGKYYSLNLGISFSPP